MIVGIQSRFTFEFFFFLNLTPIKHKKLSTR